MSKPPGLRSAPRSAGVIASSLGIVYGYGKDGLIFHRADQISKKTKKAESTSHTLGESSTSQSDRVNGI